MQASETLSGANAKAHVRIAAKARRDAIDAPGDDLVASVLSILGEAPPGVVAGYLPIGGECDPGPALDALVARGWRRVLPCTAPDRPLVFRAWTPGDVLTGGLHGTREPAADASALRPDALLIPLLAFDRAGWRLGWGGGYYDRTLAALRADGPLVAIGLAWSAQEVEACPHEAHDARLDAVATEREAIRASRG